MANAVGIGRDVPLGDPSTSGPFDRAAHGVDAVEPRVLLRCSTERSARLVIGPSARTTRPSTSRARRPISSGGGLGRRLQAGVAPGQPAACRSEVTPVLGERRAAGPGLLPSTGHGHRVLLQGGEEVGHQVDPGVAARPVRCPRSSPPRRAPTGGAGGKRARPGRHRRGRCRRPPASRRPLAPRPGRAVRSAPPRRRRRTAPRSRPAPRDDDASRIAHQPLHGVTASCISTAPTPSSAPATSSGRRGRPGTAAATRSMVRATR